MDKRKRSKLTLKIFRDIFKIFPRVQGQDFDALPTDEEIMSFLRNLVTLGKSIHSMMLLLIRCINHGELFLLSLTKVYLERELILTSFVSPKHKSFRTHPSGSGTVTKIAPSAAKIKPSVTNEGTSVKPGVPDVTKEESSKKNEEEVEDNEEEKEDDYVRTLSYYSPADDEDKTNVNDNAEGDKVEEMDDNTSQLYDDMDMQLNEPVHSDEGLVQKEGNDAKMINV
nr:hypothetical protein [Tanacetum cinerariifolium]